MSELTLFDYGILPINDAMELNAIKERIKIRLKRTAEDIIEIGKDLIFAKEKCGHGSFENWISFEFEMNIRTAQRFINAYEVFGNKNDNLSLFKPSAIYELSAPSTPESVRIEIIERVENGESINVDEIKRLKKEAADLLAEKQVIQNNLLKSNQECDMLKKQNDTFRRGDQEFIDKQIANAKAKLEEEANEKLLETEKEMQARWDKTNDERLSVINQKQRLEKELEALKENATTNNHVAIENAEARLDELNVQIESKQELLENMTSDYETNREISEHCETLREQMAIVLAQLHGVKGVAKNLYEETNAQIHGTAEMLEEFAQQLRNFATDNAEFSMITA